MLIASGLLNLFVGFLALFPGLLEAGMSQPRPDHTETGIFIALLTTGYGLYALSHLLGAAVQIAGGSCIGILREGNSSLIHALIGLAAVSFGLEIYGALYKGYLTFFAMPGVVTGALCTYLYYAAIRQRRAARKYH